MLVMARLKAIFAAFAVSIVASTALADDMDDEIVLTVLGLDETIELSINDLREIGEATFETTTIWTEGVQVFTGVPLNMFVQSFGVEDGEMVATAVNDYAIGIPVVEALEEGPMIAYRRNGENMPVRDKGPLWIVYPYDSSPEFETEVTHSRSIWQLNRISFQAE